jgi:hypothetical protein
MLKMKYYGVGVRKEYVVDDTSQRWCLSGRLGPTLGYLLHRPQIALGLGFFSMGI